MFAIFPEILHAAEKGDPETLSCLVRKYFAGSEIYAPRLRVEALLESLGIGVNREQAPYYGRIQVLDHRGQYRVTVSLSQRIDNHRELNYTLAHLLGYFLHHFLPKMAMAELTAEAYQLEGPLVPRLTLKDNLSDKAGVAPADQFALALLMPLGMVKKAHQTLPREEDCAGFFQVPVPLLRLRLQVLQLAESPKASSVLERDQSPSVPPRELTPADKGKKGQTLPRSRAKSHEGSEKSTSLARVQQSAVTRSYQQEEARKNKASEPAPASEEDTSGKGIKRLRELAKKIDRSVEI
jgi:hypothetical protein